LKYHNVLPTELWKIIYINILRCCDRVFRQKRTRATPFCNQNRMPWWSSWI